MTLLLLDTSTERGMVAYTQQESVLFKKELPFGNNQSKFLLPFLEELLTSFGSPPALDAIGVGVGPGSYTGIRLGVATAQALAYAWNVPIFGFCSLNGFVPKEGFVRFAAILDARIGGVYMRKGLRHAQGIDYAGEAEVCPLENVEQSLEGITHLITPYAKTLQSKFQLHVPTKQWIWEERAPCVRAWMACVQTLQAEEKGVIPPEPLTLLYLRETEAEREKKRGLSGEAKLL